MSDEQVTKYPLDFSALRKGSWIETLELKNILGLSPLDDPQWRFRLMRLCEQIREQAGIVTREDRDRIRLMDDLEADEYLHTQIERKVRGLSRTANLRSLIDRTDFSPERRALAESRDRIALGVSLAARNAMRRTKRLEQVTMQALSERIGGEIGKSD